VQSIWDKVWCYWEHIEEHNENLRNLMGRVFFFFFGTNLKLHCKKRKTIGGCFKE
jgi:hypothetical protein